MEDILHLGIQATRQPDRPALVMAGSGRTLTFAELNARSNRLAQFMYAHGLRFGQNVAFMLENCPEVHELGWAAQRSGLYYTPVNHRLTAEEAAYVINDCGARVLLTSARLGPLAEQLRPLIPKVEQALMVGGALPGYVDYESAIAAHSPEPLAEELDGGPMFYSSGTTGRPKGIKVPLPRMPFGGRDMLGHMIRDRLGVRAGSVYLTPAPLYHSAPIAWSMFAERLGATSLIMEKFDPLECLALIEKHRVTHAQFVPTMFVRMLKLTDAERARYDLSSLQGIVHAAAPCPVDVKRRMIEWWGPIVHEYYSSSEGCGSTWVLPEEWLKWPGTVGRSITGMPHITDENGNELPVGQAGTIWYEGAYEFSYHNDGGKTAESTHPRGWRTVGDIGYLNEDGLLFLTDRKAHMIISGGVNIYPQEAENVLTLHEAVVDVAVIGVPNPEMGEEVKAVIQLVDPARASPELAQSLIAYCRERLAHYKCPRTVDFVEQLPREPTGKLLKRVLKDRYWAGHASRII
ncbi:MAG: acyl-CoA synthetase [Gammaproteobacteria bacterium]